METCYCIEPQWPADELLMKYQYISDFFIALAYFSIPLELIYFVKKSAVFPYRWVLVQFGAFIVLCGATHLINLWTFTMHSRTVAVVMTTAKVLTAVVSCATALMLVHIIPDLLSVKTRELFLKNKAAELDREMGLIRTQEETGRHVRMLTHEIRSTLDRHTILKTTLVELGRTLALEECALWMPTRTGLELQLSYTLHQQNPVGYTVPINLPVISQVFSSNRAVKISPNSPVASLRPRAGRYVAGEVVAVRVPLLHLSNFQINDWPELSTKRYALMVLMLPSDSARQWRVHELELVEVVADQVAVALSHAAILEESMRARDLLMEQNVALDLARREAETAIRARNDFLAVMNHEMRTPMHAIIALSSLLQETELTPEQRLMVETILKSSNLLATLINDVLDLSRLEDGSLQLDIGTFNLHAVFKEVLNLIKPVTLVKKLSLTLHLGLDLPVFAVGDEKRLMQAILNVVGNARNLVFSWALCAVCLLGHISHFFGAKASWIHTFHTTQFHLSLCLFTLLGPGRQLIIDGMKSLVKGAPNMNTLVGLGALSSFSVSSLAALMPKLGWKAFFEEPVMLIAFVLLGRNLEQRAKIRAASDMTGLLSILPSKARLVVDGDTELSSTVEIPCSSLSIGDEVIVLPGDRIPADGIVKSGRSIVDESSFTGEPLPVTKLPGSQVAAGTINLNGTLTVKVHRQGGDTAMGDIIRLVEEAQSREAPVQRLADKVSGHFTYGVMVLSAATFIFWSQFGSRILPAAFYHGSSVSLALQLSCSVLVVACPCALGLATPTAMLVGTSLGATKGLLLRGGNILEQFSMVDTVVFDKTGTLTVGRPVVTKVFATSRYERNVDTQTNSHGNYSENEILKFAAAVESNTVHPVGKAIVEAARAVNGHSLKVVEGTFVEEPGSGAVATVENRIISIGTLDWVQRHGVIVDDFQETDDLKAHDLKAHSVVYVGIDNSLAGCIYYEDGIREDARHVVDTLSRQGINTYILSGDKRSNAEYIASLVGIPKEKVRSGVKPHEKKKFISELQENNNIVAMVGDGINDAAALATADIGIAMGGGVGAASEVSPIVLMGNRLSQLLDALELSRLTMKTVKQNLWWAFGYNIVGIPVAAGVLLPITGTILTPSIAGALMGLSSVGVMANSLLLRIRFSQNRKKSLEDQQPKEK